MKDLLSLEHHGTRTPPNLFARIGVRLLASPPASTSTTNSADQAAIATYTA